MAGKLMLWLFRWIVGDLEGAIEFVESPEFEASIIEAAEMYGI